MAFYEHMQMRPMNDEIVEQANRYWSTYFRIRSDYTSEGWSNPEAGAAFKRESCRLFAGAGWTVENGDRSGICDTVKKGQQELYLHPTAFSGVVSEREITQVEKLLKDATTFRLQWVDRYEEYFDLNDENYWMRLENKRPAIEAAILERYRTKRSNLYIIEDQTLKIATKFSIHRLCDKSSYRDKANLYVERLIEEMIADGRLVTAQTRYGLGVRTASKRDKRLTKDS